MFGGRNLSAINSSMSMTKEELQEGIDYVVNKVFST